MPGFYLISEKSGNEDFLIRIAKTGRRVEAVKIDISKKKPASNTGKEEENDMSKAVNDYLSFCNLFRGGNFFANMNAVSKSAYWTSVFLTIGLSILVGSAILGVDSKSSAGRALQLYLASAAVPTVLFGIEVPFLVILLSFGGIIFFRRN